MRDHFEPIYAHRFYVGSILCAYIESKSIFDHFELICGRAQERDHLGVHRNGIKKACTGTVSKNFPGRPTPQPQPLQLEPNRHTRAVDH